MYIRSIRYPVPGFVGQLVALGIWAGENLSGTPRRVFKGNSSVTDSGGKGQMSKNGIRNRKQAESRDMPTSLPWFNALVGKLSFKVGWLWNAFG